MIKTVVLQGFHIRAGDRVTLKQADGSRFRDRLVLDDGDGHLYIEGALPTSMLYLKALLGVDWDIASHRPRGVGYRKGDEVVLLHHESSSRIVTKVISDFKVDQPTWYFVDGIGRGTYDDLFKAGWVEGGSFD